MKVLKIFIVCIAITIIATGITTPLWWNKAEPYIPWLTNYIDENINLQVAGYALNSSQGFEFFQEPIQMPYTGEPIIRKLDGGEYALTPLAKYEITAKVASIKYYNPAGSATGYADKLSPYDLCLVWGKVANPEFDRFIEYSQSNRRCSFINEKGSILYDSRTQSYEGSMPKEMRQLFLNDSYMWSHVSNNHIIPANEDINTAIKSIKKNDKVSIKGFLVNVYGKGLLLWPTSLTRTDRDDGSCEIIYVEEVRIGNETYGQ